MCDVMKLTRRTFLFSSAAAIAYGGLSKFGLTSGHTSPIVDLASGRSKTTSLNICNYSVTAEIEFGSAPIENDIIEFYWSIPMATPINSQFIGFMATLEEKFTNGYVGKFQPGFEEGQLIVINGGSQPMKLNVEMIELLPEFVDEDNSISVKTGDAIIFKAGTA